MSRGKELAKNTAIIAIGKVSTQLITFLLLPIYTSILSTEEYGIVDLLNTIVALFVPIVTFQIEQALFRNLIDNRKSEDEIKKIISTVFFTILIQVLIYIVLFMTIATLIKNDYKYFLLTNVIACIFSSIMLQLSRGLGDNKKYAFGSFIASISILITNILFIVVFKFGAYGMLTANFIGNVLCGLYILISKRIYKYISIKLFRKSLLEKLWKYSIPLIPNGISWWVFNSSSRVIISYVLGVGSNGVFAAASKFSTVYITLYNIFNMSWTESAALHINDDDNSKFLSKIINTVLKLFSSICIGIIAFMPFIFPILINKKYSEAYFQIPILLIASLLNVVVGLISVVYIAKKDTKAVAKTSIFSAIINIVINLCLINFIGLYSASIATFIAYFVMALYRLKDVKKYVVIKIEKLFIVKTTVVIFIVLLIYYYNNMYINIAAALLAVLYAWDVNRNSIKVLTGMFKGKLVKS